MSIEELRDDAELLSEEMLAVLMDVEEHEPEVQGGEGETAIREALSHLARFRGRSSLAENALKDLTSAKELLDKSVALFQSEVIREALADLIGYFESLRRRAIDKIIEADRRGGAMNSLPPLSQDLALSQGSPAILTGVSLALPRILPRDLDALARTGELVIAKPRPKPKDREPGEQSRGGDEGERHQIEVHARDLMEDLAAFSSLRVLDPLESWSSSAPFEKRLLASLDALYALARPVRRDAAVLDLAECLYAYATEWIVPDRGRTFAFALALSSVSHPSGLLWSTMGFKAAEDRALDAYCDAFALSANPRMPEHLVSLLSDDLPREQVIVVLDACYRRKLFKAGKMLAYSGHPDPLVASAAIRCLTYAPAPLAEAVLAERAAEESALVRATASGVLIERGLGDGLTVLRAVVEDLTRSTAEDLAPSQRLALQTALRWLAVVGEAVDADRVWRAAHLLRSYREVGFFGHFAHVALLFSTMEALDHAGSGDAPEPGWAEKLDRAAEAILRITGVPVPSFGSGQYDLDAFRARWPVEAPRIENVAVTSGRLRKGEAWSRAAALIELFEPATRQGDRRLLADEVAKESKGDLRFDLDGWSNAQDAILKLAATSWEVDLPDPKIAWRLPAPSARD